MRLDLAEGPAASLSLADIKRRLADIFTEVLHLLPGDLEQAQTIHALGVGSLNAVELLEAINTAFDLRLPTSIAFEFNTLEGLAGYIEQERRGRATLPPSSVAAARPSFPDSGIIQPPPVPQLPVHNDDIAIIGLSCRCAGANGPEEFWSLISQGVNAVREVSDADWLAYMRENGGGQTPVRYGALDELERFDPLFFHISPKEAELMDPCQRILLEQCYAALEDAGCLPSQLNGKQVGAFIGSMGIVPAARDFSHYSLLGTDTSIMAARIAYHLNLKGPAMAINTACSSSLVAIDLACRQIRSGELDLAIAGGITIYSHPAGFISMNNAGMLSPTGQCRPFDNAADGIVVGDGVGVVVLKSLRQAERDGDEIYGIIRGSGTNQDGQTNGITVPSFQAQSELEEAVYVKNRIDVEQIQYVEAHGTATKLGDPVEVHALTRAFAKFTGKKRFCGIGSLKANIGHTTAAAGVLNLIKVLLAMKHKQLPPTIHFQQENEHIDFANSPFYVNAALKEWGINARGTRMAAVSSFGFSGTNAHLVVESAGRKVSAAAPPMIHEAAPGLLVLSAESLEVLRAYAGQLKSWLQANDEAQLADVLYTYQVARENMSHRLAIVVGSKAALIERLERFAGGQTGNVASTVYYRSSDKDTLDISDTEEGQVFIRQLSASGNIRKLAELWLFKNRIDWAELYPPGSVKRLAGLPTYPFAKMAMNRGPLPVQPLSPERASQPHQPAAQGVPQVHQGGRRSSDQPRQPTAQGVPPQLELRPAEAEAASASVEALLGDWLAALLQIPRAQIDYDQDLMRYGFDSIAGLSLAQTIKERCGVEVLPRVFFDIGTIRQLAYHLQSLPGWKGLSEAQPAPAAVPEQAEPLEGPAVFPLSAGQQGMWYIQQKAPHASEYNVPAVFRIRHALDPQVLRAAFRRVAERHPLLRSRIVLEGRELAHRVGQPDDVQFAAESVSGLSAQELQRHVQSLVGRPFQLEREAPLRVHLLSAAADDHTLVINIHHIAFDGSSVTVLLGELTHAYAALAGGAPLPELALPRAFYADFVAWERQRLAGEEGVRLQQYWKRKLAGEWSELDWPVHGKIGLAETSETGVILRDVAPELAARLEQASREHQTSPFVFMLSVFHSLLHRYTNHGELVVGTPVEQRPAERFRDVIGNFINLVPIRAAVSASTPFASLLRAMQATVQEAIEHSAYPFAEIMRAVGAQTPGHTASATPLQAGFVFQNWFRSETQFVSPDVPAGARQALRLEYVDDIKQRGDFELELDVVKRGDRYQIMFKYKSQVLDHATVSRLAGHYISFLQAAAADPDRRIGDIDLLTPQEHEAVALWNRTEAVLPETVTIHGLFEEQARKHPDRIAVMFEERTLTYGELNQLANRLARKLREQGLQPDDTVGLLMERSLEMMIGLLAVLKAGGAFVPLDPEAPAERIRYMLDNSGARTVLLQRRSLLKIELDASVICLDEADAFAADDSNLPPAGKPGDLAYVIYTSGSTGKPKGVMIEHRSLMNRLLWTRKAYPLSAHDTFLQKTPYTFDCSVWELFCWIVEGAKLVFLPPQAERDPQLIADTVAEQRVTLIHFVPSMLNLFLEYIQTSPASLQGLKTLRRVFTTGEPLTVPQVKLFHATLHCEHATCLTNLYGPTETTIEVSFFDCPADEELETIPIGKPIDNTQLYIVNACDQLQPVGVTGELCIGGTGVGRGYIRNPQLTADKFVANPFQPGTRMYRTGDLARWLPDGNIDYLGRSDRQVKIRGVRMELGEIEAAVLEHEAIREACVVIDKQKDAAGLARLKLIYSTKGGVRLSTQETRDFLKMKLPDYMIPALYVQLDALPLTAHGKLDFKALGEGAEGAVPAREIPLGQPERGGEPAGEPLAEPAAAAPSAGQPMTPASGLPSGQPAVLAAGQSAMPAAEQPAALAAGRPAVSATGQLTMPAAGQPTAPAPGSGVMPPAEPAAGPPTAPPAALAAATAAAAPQPGEPQRDEAGGGASLDEIRALVAAIFAETLERADIDPDVNFFDLGGHSMLLVKVTIRLREALQWELSPAQLLQHPTVNALAAYLNERSHNAGSMESRQPKGRGLRERLSRSRELRK